MKSNKDKHPLVTIVTVVKNGAKNIRQCIESVLGQDYSNIEYIVIDGDSIDGTQAIIEEYAQYIDYYVSEPDRGIADAWNKGICASSGKYIGFLNSDDYYTESFVRKSVCVGETFKNNVVLYGLTYIIDKGVNGVVWNKKYDRDEIKKGFGFKHPSCLVSKGLFEDIGMFDVNIKIACDSDWLLRCAKADVDFVATKGVVVMRKGGVSDKYWKKASYEYLDRLVYHGILDNKKALNTEKVRINILCFVKKMGVAPFVKKAKTQIYYVGVFLINFICRYLPLFARKYVYRMIGYEIGEESFVHADVKFFHIGKIKVGNNSNINRGVYLDNRVGIEIGSSVSISQDVKIYTLGHEINDDVFSVKGDKVIIGDFVVVFSGAMIMPGVTIEQGAVVMPGAIVTKNVGKKEIVGGNPARIIGTRDADPIYKFADNYWFTH